MSQPRMPPVSDAREDADLASSSDAYAARFSGPVGRWFLDLQANITLDALAGLAPGATVLDVGGGHAQLVPPLVARGYRVTVVGSDRACARHLGPWLAAGQCRFEVADLQRLPCGPGTFSAVLCFRLLAHSVDWVRLIGELCRVAADRVVADYPSRRSVNVIADRMFPMKRSVEGALTRPYAVYDPRDIAEAFTRHGFRVVRQVPQFFMPMMLYRMMRSDRFGRAVEWPARRLGVTRLLGSPIIVRADRRRA
jgi:ubiquinone/menaquinone biosynthesis C-methylase UbiE